MDWLDLLAVQWTLESLLQHHSSKASILCCSVFFVIQLSYPYMTTGKTITSTRWTFVGKVMPKPSPLVPSLAKNERKTLGEGGSQLWHVLTQSPVNFKGPPVCQAWCGKQACGFPVSQLRSESQARCVERGVGLLGGLGHFLTSCLATGWASVHTTC